MNKRVNKTTTRKDHLKSVRETSVDKKIKDEDDRPNKRLLTKHNHDLSGSQDAMANATDEEEILARQQYQ